MSKFCTKCGNPMDEGAKFCGACGAAVPVIPAAPTEPVAPVAPAEPVTPAESVKPVAPKKKTGLIIGIVAVIAALIVAAVLIPWGDIFGGGSDDDDSEGGSAAAAGSPEDAVNLYYDALYEGKADMLKSLAPQDFWDWAEDTYGVTAKNVVSFFKEEMKEDYIDEMEDQYGKNYTVTFTVEEEKKLDDEYLESIAEFLGDEYDIKESSVTGAVQMAGVVEARGSDGEDSDDMDELYAVQIDGKWYYCYISLDPDYSYVSFPLTGLVIRVSEEMEDNSEEDIPVQDNQDSDVPVPNPPVQNEQVDAVARMDPVRVMEYIWNDYLADHDRFYTVGGDPDNRVDDGPALHDMYAYRDNLIGTYKVPENWMDSIDFVATLTDGYVASDFCCAMYLMDTDMSVDQIDNFADDFGTHLKKVDWEGYEPERILVCRVEDQCVLVAFGNADRIIDIRDTVQEMYNTMLWYDMPLEK